MYAAVRSVCAARSSLDSQVAALFRSVNVGAVFEVAAAKRRATGDGDPGAYGEVVPYAFVRLLYRALRAHAKISDAPNWGTFVDVGSGSGIGVFAALLALPFERCAGVELLWEMHRVAEIAAQRLAKQASEGCVLQKHSDDHVTLTVGQSCAAELLCADALAPGGRAAALLAEASCVFCNCISWPSEIKLALSEAVTRVGAVLLMTAPLPVSCSVATAGDAQTASAWVVYTTFCALSFTPSGRIYLYVRRR